MMNKKTANMPILLIAKLVLTSPEFDRKFSIKKATANRMLMMTKAMGFE
jgi:hypothetical protein